MTRNSDRLLGLICLALAVLIVFGWVPLDTETGLVEKVRRRWTLGDAFGPTVAGAVIALGAVMTFLRPTRESPGLSRANWIWMLKLLVVFGLSLMLIRYAGPAFGLLTESGYRPLRGSLPWKLTGFVMGGAVLIAGLGSLVRGHFAMTDLIVGLVAALIMALAYDLPFDDLVLPPNGDL